MKVKTISFTYERKWNTGNYESATVGMSAWAHLDEGEDPVQAARQLEQFVKGEVKSQSLPLLGERNAQVKEYFADLPVIEGNGNGREVA
jgi:ribosomal protein L10